MLDTVIRQVHQFRMFNLNGRKCRIEIRKTFAIVSARKLFKRDIKKTFTRWAKEEHLQHIRESGYFRYAREIVFDNEEPCDARRLIGLSQSQGGLQALLKSHPEAVEEVCAQFAETVRRVYGDRRFLVRFCYRMRIGVK